VLKGDLVATPLPQVLRQLADSASSGCLHVLDARGEEGRVYLRGGAVYAVQVPGARPLLGQHLVSNGSLGPEMLAEALEAQRTELQGWKLGELLVHLGYVDAPVVEAFLAEQVRDQAGDLLRWPTGTWKFRVNERTREDVARPTTVEELLADCDRRAREWDTLCHVVHGPEAVPVLSAAGSSDTEMAIDAEAWSLLCKVDGTRTLAELSLDCGFTLFEAGRIVHTLVRAGLLEVDEPQVPVEEEPITASVGSRLTAAFAPTEQTAPVIPHQADEPSPEDVAQLVSSALLEERGHGDLAVPSAEEVEGSINRISAALSAMLGPTTDDTLFAPRPRKESRPHTKSTDRSKGAKKPPETEREKEKAERDRRRREADAAELASAQAELEASRKAAEAPAEQERDAEIVSLAAVRREAARREEQETRASGQARLESEARDLAQEQEAHDADRAQLEADTRAAEEERLRAAEEARLAEAARKAEAERQAEEARQEELREQEQARFAEEERLRAAEEARLAEARTKLEQERAALAEERARLEQEVRAAQEAAEAARLAAEAEQARLAEEARLADEARQAAEREAARLAAEAEQARWAAELEAARRAEEAEAARLAAEAEQARLAEEIRLAEELRLAEEIRLTEEAAERARVESELRREAEAQAAAAATEQARLEAEAAANALEEAQTAADAELVAQAEEAAQRTAASSVFAELSATAASAVPTVEPDVVNGHAAPAQIDLEEPEEPEEPAGLSPAADTDMASLFRELSSLGMEDEPPAPTSARPPSRPAAPTAQQKKKKGLFGR
jgi:hypothetical protein